MNNQRGSSGLSILLWIVVLGVVFFVGKAVYMFGYEPSHIKQVVGSAYESLNIPRSLTLESKAATGDVIDSPDEFGWEYIYASTASKSSILTEFDQDLQQQGFTVKSDGKSVSASQISKNLKLYITGGDGQKIWVEATRLHA